MAPVKRFPVETPCAHSKYRRPNGTSPLKLSNSPLQDGAGKCAAGIPLQDGAGKRAAGRLHGCISEKRGLRVHADGLEHDR
jgi:hypothetical protein